MLPCLWSNGATLTNTVSEIWFVGVSDNHWLHQRVWSFVFLNPQVTYSVGVACFGAFCFLLGSSKLVFILPFLHGKDECTKRWYEDICSHFKQQECRYWTKYAWYQWNTCCVVHSGSAVLIWFKSESHSSCMFYSCKVFRARFSKFLSGKEFVQGLRTFRICIACSLLLWHLLDGSTIGWRSGTISCW